MRLRFPMMGHGFGPGGRFNLRRRRPKRDLRRKRMDASMAARDTTRDGDSIGVGSKES